MAPPLREAASPVMTQVRDDQNTEKVLPHSDPTFYEVAKRLDWGKGDWHLTGPTFEDGTKPVFEINWRLGELVMRILMRYANAKLSREMRAELKKGAPVGRVRLVKKLNPVTDQIAKPGSHEVSNTIRIH